MQSVRHPRSKIRIALTLTLAALCAGLAIASVASHVATNRLHPMAAPGPAQLRAVGGRDLEQRQSPSSGKFDGTLADLSRHAVLLKPGSGLAALHALSPAARFKLGIDGVTALVAVDAVTVGDPQALQDTLVGLGMEHPAVYANDVGGWLPVAQLQAAAAHAEVHSLRAALSRTRTGVVTSQGDFVQHSAAVRSSDALTGSGVTVGVLSDSFDCYATYAAAGSGVPASGYAGYAYNGFTATAATDISTGDLPSTVNVLEEADCLNYGAPLFPPLGDEGRAMLQVVHDVAPGASLAFYTANISEADFANGIGKLAAAGAKVIADDVGYFDEPFYQDGILAQAIDAVEAEGVAYFSAAGNDGNSAYENTAPSFGTKSSTAPTSGEYLLNFDTTNATTTTVLPVTIDALQPGEFAAIVVEWDQPYVTGAPNSGGATSRIDVCVTGAATSVYTIENYDGNSVTCTGPNAAGVDPVQILIIANPANATASTPKETLNLVVGLADGTAAPGRVKVVVETDGQNDPPITTFATPNAANSATLQGHPGAAGALAVGAAFYFETPACGTDPAVIEAFSAEGGAPILFDSTGVRLATPTTRQKPDVVGPDGGNDTFLGFTLASDGIPGGQLDTPIAACQNDASYPNFFGTSAATPHVAGIATLILQANAAATPTQIASALRSSALAMGGAAGFNYTSGFGFVQADAALALIPPAAPRISAAAASITAGGSTTLTWSSVNASGCTASGSWSGAEAASGTQTISPAASGVATYTLTCTNAAGTSPASSVSVTVNPAPSGGGGSLDWVTVLGLAVLFSRRLRRPL
jgi:hypothetical protein